MTTPRISAFWALIGFFVLLADAADLVNAQEATPGAITKETVYLFAKGLRPDDPNNGGYEFFLSHAARIDSLMMGERDDKLIYETLGDVLYSDQIASQLSRHADGSIHWDEMVASVASKYPTVDPSVVTRMEKMFRDRRVIKAIWEGRTDLPEWDEIRPVLEKRFPGYDCQGAYLMQQAFQCYKKKNWDKGIEAVKLLIEADGKRAEWHSGTLQGLLIYSMVLNYSSDPATLMACARWMRMDIDDETGPRPGYWDTYANLLYKLGLRDEALDWERRAAVSDKDPELAANLAKMETGKPTWTE